MWLIPLGLSLRHLWWRFIFTWLLFSCITGLIARKALQKPIDGTTPRLAENKITKNNSKQSIFRLVYKWFLLLYKLSYVLGIIGYVIMMAAFFGLNLVFDAKVSTWMDCGLLFVFYGLYYGVLGRDISEICADKMASHVGVRARKKIVKKTVANLLFTVLYKRRDAYKKFRTRCLCCLW